MPKLSRSRAPATHQRARARRQALLARHALRRAKAQQQAIDTAIAEHGERMSDEGRGLLDAVVETLRGAAVALRGK